MSPTKPRTRNTIILLFGAKNNGVVCAALRSAANLPRQFSLVKISEAIFLKQA
jgi:hypothetical protein